MERFDRSGILEGMATRLIVNADDFGLTPGINRAIAALHDAGCLFSTTLMATGECFQEAVALALARPRLGVGCHLVFTDGVPASPPEQIGSLLGPDRLRFRPSLTQFAADALRGHLRPEEIAREAEAQIRKLQHCGIHPTHVDTHKHTHVLPVIHRPIAEAMRRTGVQGLRNPFEPGWSAALTGSPQRRLLVHGLGLLRGRFLAQPPLAQRLILTTDGTVGISATGDLDESSLRHLLALMPEGTWELVCHPGFQDAALAGIPTRLRREREVEYHALLACLAEGSSQRQGLELIHYGKLSAHVAP